MRAPRFSLRRGSRLVAAGCKGSGCKVQKLSTRLSFVTRQLYVRVQSLSSLNMKTRGGFSDDSDDKVIIFARVTKRTKVLSNSLSHAVSKYCRITGGGRLGRQHPLVKQKHLINHRQRSVNTAVKWRKTSCPGCWRPSKGSRRSRKTLRLSL